MEIEHILSWPNKDNHGSPAQERTINIVNCLLLVYFSFPRVSIFCAAYFSCPCFSFCFYFVVQQLSCYDGWLKGARFSLMVHQYSPLTKISIQSTSKKY